MAATQEAPETYVQRHVEGNCVSRTRLKDVFGIPPCH